MNRSLTFILFVAIIGGLGLGYCEIAYHNGADPLKDGVLIGIISAATTAFLKFSESRTI